VFPPEAGDLFSAAAAKPQNFLGEQAQNLAGRLKDLLKRSKSKPKSKPRR
jgi:hypothetical protein